MRLLLEAIYALRLRFNGSMMIAAATELHVPLWMTLAANGTLKIHQKILNCADHKLNVKLFFL